MAECDVCGRTLRTGRKYCYEHRNTRTDSLCGDEVIEDIPAIYKKKRTGVFILFFLGAMGLIFAIFSLIFAPVSYIGQAIIMIIVAIVLIFIGRARLKQLDKEEAEELKKQEEEGKTSLKEHFLGKLNRKKLIEEAKTEAEKEFYGGKNNKWELLKEVPDWVLKKMNKNRTNHTNGEHYRYKREGNIYYRKLK